MSRLVTAVLVVAVAAPFAAFATPTSPLVVGTFNIKYTSPRQTRLIWADRRDAVVETLSAMDADIVGFQEMETFAGRHYNGANVQLEWIRERFPDFGFAAVHDPAEFPSTQPIMYRTERLELIEDGFFSFSATPEVAYSRPWYDSWPSFCSWARFRDRDTGLVFYVYNIHFDVVRRGNRIESSTLR